MVYTKLMSYYPKLTAFLEQGCGCKQNGGKPCYTSFSREQYEASRMQCAELSWKELNLVILGQISALLPSSSQNNTHRPSTQRQCMAFHHHGVPVCWVTFLKLHGIGKMVCTDYEQQSISSLQDWIASRI